MAGVALMPKCCTLLSSGPLSRGALQRSGKYIRSFSVESKPRSRAESVRLQGSNRSSSNVPNTGKPAPKLLKVPREALPDSFYQRRAPPHYTVYSKLFRLSLLSLSARTCNDINIGPSWLRGSYPAGLLEGRHERRRPINQMRSQRLGWREVDDDQIVEPYRTPTESLQRKRPLILPAYADGAERLTQRYVPVLSLVSPKVVDKRSVYRNKAKSRTQAAFQRALPSYIDSIPLHDQKGNVLVYTFQPSAETIKTSMDDLQAEMERMLERLSKQQKIDQQRSKQKRGQRGERTNDEYRTRS